MSTANGSSTKSVWDSNWIKNVPDPTRIFSILVLVIMCVKYAQAHEWNFYLLMPDFWGHPCVVLTMTSAVLTVHFGSKQGVGNELPQYDRWAAEWYWWNSWLYHAVMDGGSGTFQWVPVVVQQYDTLDYRFTSGHVVPWTIGWIEFFFHYPLCLVTLYGILQNKPWRYAMECITSSFHLFGAIAFVLAEVYEGQHNIPALDPVGKNGLKLNLYHFTYYWFGFWFCNGVWVVVPIIRMRRAIREISKAMVQASQQGVKTD